MLIEMLARLIVWLGVPLVSWAAEVAKKAHRRRELRNAWPAGTWVTVTASYRELDTGGKLKIVRYCAEANDYLIRDEKSNEFYVPRRVIRREDAATD